MSEKGPLYTTKPFMSGRSQTIRIPKELCFDDTKAVINCVSDFLIITPREVLERMLFSSVEMFADELPVDGRPEETVKNEALM